MATIIDIAEKLGISKGTVSKALNNKEDISETLRKKILETAVEMNYEKVRVRKDDTKKLCIIVENMAYENPVEFGYDIIMGFKKLAVPEGWEVETVDMTAEKQKLQSYDTFMLENKYMGAFILGFSLKDPWMEELKTSRTPAVLYDNYIQENPQVTYVGVHTEEAFDMAVSYLKDLGHTKIGYLGGAMESHVIRARYDAYLRAMALHELSVAEGMVGYAYHISDCTQNHLPLLLKNQVTAILCSHDDLAIAVMNHCMELGYRIPRDISVIGFDDAPFSAYTSPPLTTLCQNRNALGQCGYYALGSLLNNTPISCLLLRAELIKRGSAGPPLIPTDYG